MSEKDPQRDRMYAMERIELRGHGRHKAPIAQLRRWAKKACQLYGVPPVTISVRRCGGWGGLYWDDKIQLAPKRDRNGMSLAHELAHHLTTHLAPRAQPHGPLFAMYYGSLLHGMRLVPFAGFKAICKQHGVKIAPPRKAALKPA